MDYQNDKDWDKFMRKAMNDVPSNDDKYITPKLVCRDALKKEVEQVQLQKEYKISYKMKPEDIMSFVSGLHNIQLDMIETIVIRKEREGFPEANVVINHIKNLR